MEEEEDIPGESGLLGFRKSSVPEFTEIQSAP